MRGSGALRALPADPAVPLTAAGFPAEPYPGARPDFSFVQDEADRIRPVAGGVWPGRVAVLAYGSNACPGKIAWLRGALGLRGDVVVQRARCRDVAAVWAAGFRVVDDQRPATLAAVPGADETHAVWFATPDQLAVLDVCEGRGVRYERAVVRTGTVTLDSGEMLDAPLAYVGASAIRMPLLVDGAVVRCADVPQAEAAALVGVPAAGHGLDLLGC